jgi:hypothetical protein
VRLRIVHAGEDPELDAIMYALADAENRDREDEQRTRYESHQWNPTEDGDDECIVCGVTWQDCDDDCPGAAT